jgi:diguanylate cyclase (GGDEF)-like protein/PAS domain S-box-containing protein
MSFFRQNPATLYGFVLVGGVCLFWLDIRFPMGSASGIPYVLLVLLGMLSPKKHFILFLSGLASFLTVAGHFFSHPFLEPWTVLPDRFFSLVTIGLAGFLGYQTKEAGEKLLTLESRLNQLVEGISGIMWVADREGGFTSVSPGISALIGFSSDEMYGGGAQLRYERIHPLDVGEVKEAFQKLATESKGYDIQYRFQKKDGKWVWLREKSLKTYQQDGSWYAEGMVSDITHERETEKAFLTDKNQMKLAQNRVGFGTWEWYIQGDQMTCSEECSRLLNQSLKVHEVPFQEWLDWICPEDRDLVKDKMMAGLKKRSPSETEFRVVCPNGEVRWILSKAEPFEGEREGEKRIQGVAIDITKHKGALITLDEQTLRDPLTGLYHRSYFDQRLKEEMNRAERGRYPMAILLCDLENFHQINEARGHQSGNHVLKAMAKSIQNSTRKMDVVFRWGGDSFMVILSDIKRGGLNTVSDRIRNGVKRFAKEANLSLDLMIGAAIYKEHGRTVEELVHLAGRALQMATMETEKIKIGVEDCIPNDQTVKAVFQPVVDIQSNRVIGFEAFSRDPKGNLSIQELFARYQAAGQLEALKAICLKSQLKTAQTIGLNRVFINVDFTLLGKTNLIPKPPGLEVILEISELEPFQDIGIRLEVAGRWRKLGYRFAIDDFGAGFVSFPFIAQFVPEYIKVDRSSILHAVASEKFRGFLKDQITALKNYAPDGIIAEGVETEKELNIVKKMGIHIAQGYLFGRPKELS